MCVTPESFFTAPGARNPHVSQHPLPFVVPYLQLFRELLCLLHHVDWQACQGEWQSGDCPCASPTQGGYSTKRHRSSILSCSTAGDIGSFGCLKQAVLNCPSRLSKPCAVLANDPFTHTLPYLLDQSRQRQEQRVVLLGIALQVSAVHAVDCLHIIQLHVHKAGAPTAVP